MGVIWLWWIVRRQWVAVLWTVLGGAAIFLASLPFIGLDPWLQFVTVLRNISDVNGVLRNLGLGSTALSLGLSEPVANLALIGGYVLALGAILLSLRRDREIGFSVTLMATLLLSAADVGPLPHQPDRAGCVACVAWPALGSAAAPARVASAPASSRGDRGGNVGSVPRARSWRACSRSLEW